MIYDIYLLTAIGLSPGGSSTVHIYTQTVHGTTQITANLEECGPCPVFASFTLAFALQLRKKHGKTSVRVIHGVCVCVCVCVCSSVVFIHSLDFMTFVSASVMFLWIGFSHVYKEPHLHPLVTTAPTITADATL